MPTLFCGVKFTLSMENAIAHLPAKLYKQYIGSDLNHLSQIEKNQVLYLGKFLDSTFPYSELTLQETNIYSILKKLLPDFNPNLHPIMLVPYERRF